MIRKRIYLVFIVACLLILIAAVAAGCAGKGTSDGTGGGQVTLIFEKDARGEGYAVAGFEKSASVRGGQKVVIPDTYNGLAVTSVKSGAFENSDKIVSVKAGNNLKNIGDKAFAGCTALTEVEIGNHVTEVGEYVFSGCSALEKVVFPGNLRILTRGMFSGCSSLKEVAVPDSVKEIRGSVFYNCSSLKSVSLGDSVTLVGLSAFYGCAGIENVYYSGGLADWLAISFFDGVANPLNGGAALYLNGAPCTEPVLPEGTVKVGNNVFFGCESLTSVTIPASVTNIGSQAFSGCKNLAEIRYEGDLTAWCGIDGLANVTTRGVSLYIDGEPLGSELTIPDSVTSVKYGTFLGCTGLTSVVVGDNVTSISEGAFSGCSSLESITLPFVGNNADGTSAGLFGYIFGATEYVGGTTVRQVYNDRESVYCIPSRLRSVTLTGGNIPQSAFSGCSMLTSVNMPETLAKIDSYAFSDCTGLASVTIPDSVGSMGSHAFYGCTGLTGVTIGNSVASIGERAFYNCRGLDSVTIPDSVKSIGDCAFQGCTGLNSATIGNSVTSIGWGTFSECTGLASVVVGNSVTDIGSNAFYNCTGLTSVTIPDSVTSIGDYAFSDCTGLTSVAIGNSVKSIGSDAFRNCYKLVEVYNTSSLYITAGSSDNGYVGYYAKNVYTEENGSRFTDTSDGYRFIYDGTKGYLVSYFGNKSDITLPDSFSAYDGTTVNTYDIYQYAFCGNTYLISLTIPDSVTSIGFSAFFYCTGLTSVYYAGDIADWCGISFGDMYANPLCYAGKLYIDGQLVTELVIPDTVTEIKDYAFYNCTGLTSVTIGNSVTSIGNYAFYNCNGLTSVNYSGDIASWLGISFGDQYANPLGYADELYIGDQLIAEVLVIPDSVTEIKSYVFSGYTGFTSVDIGNSVTSIEYSAFEGCTGLTSVTIGSSVTSIGDWAFNNCTGLTSITIPDSVTSIGSYAFEDCTGLTSVTIPDSVTSIGYYAFSGCTGLTSVTIPDSVTSIGNDTFSGCTNLIQKENGVSYVDKWVIECDTSVSEVILRNGTVGIGDHAFEYCTELTSVTIPETLTSIGEYAFRACNKLTSVIFEDTEGWQVSWSSDFHNYTSLSSADLADASTAATYLKSTYYNYDWRKVEISG